ncbi:unnamed protein product [Pylaiella littoralis]
MDDDKSNRNNASSNDNNSNGGSNDNNDNATEQRHQRSSSIPWVEELAAEKCHQPPLPEEALMDDGKSNRDSNSSNNNATAVFGPRRSSSIPWVEEAATGKHYKQPAPQPTQAAAVEADVKRFPGKTSSECTTTKPSSFDSPGEAAGQSLSSINTSAAEKALIDGRSDVKDVEKVPSLLGTVAVPAVAAGTGAISSDNNKQNGPTSSTAVAAAAAAGEENDVIKVEPQRQQQQQQSPSTIAQPTTISWTEETGVEETLVAAENTAISSNSSSRDGRVRSKRASSVSWAEDLAFDGTVEFAG